MRPELTHHQEPSVTPWRILIAAACLAMLVGTPLPHLDSDAALFGKIAKNILDSGEWLTLGAAMAVADGGDNGQPSLLARRSRLGRRHVSRGDELRRVLDPGAGGAG